MTRRDAINLVATWGQAHRRLVVRGASFFNNQRNVRAAYRNNNHAADRNDNLGFRVVVSTFFEMPELPGGDPLPGRGEEWRSLFLAAPGRGPAGRIATAPRPRPQ